MALSLDRWAGKVCVVTGASSGIGAAIAEQLACNGLTVVAVARRKEKLEELESLVSNKGGKLYCFRADVTKEENILSLFNWVKQNLEPVSVFINAAGLTRSSRLVDGDTKLWKEVLDTNVLGLCIATKEAVQSMRKNNVSGHIIHINSVLGHEASDVNPNQMYPASKFAVTALTETLRQELNSIGSKIKITSISPGLVRTEIFEAAAINGGNPELNQVLNEKMKNELILESRDIADAVIYVLSTPPHVQVQDLIIRHVDAKIV